jgi:L-rhamnose mutarotase
MERVCWTMRVRPEKLEAYKAAHEAVWPEMLAALSATGWTNYSLFLDDDGLLIAYLETPDFEAAVAAMEETDVNTHWQAAMSEYLIPPLRRIEEVFHLD